MAINARPSRIARKDDINDGNLERIFLHYDQSLAELQTRIATLEAANTALTARVTAAEARLTAHGI